MKAMMFVIVGLLASDVLWATCKSDAGGTFKTKQLELRPITSVDCEGCREINHHPTDIRNFMWNWVVLGRGGTLTPGTGSLGRYIFVVRLDQGMTVTPIFGDGPGSNVLSIPVCNDHGQCGTGTVELEHNLIGLRSAYGFRIGINTGIRNIHITVTQPNGDQIRNTYSANRMTSHLSTPRFKMPVPATKKPDFAKDGDCLNNFGEKRPPDSQMRPVNTTPGRSGESGDDPYGHWHDEEAAYGGRAPEMRCGNSTVAGGGSTRTCGWFWH